ncbi:MAG: hypothetical protein KN64_00705 [Sulfurovum sp. AS07-7]|nr:MAG: hypothetical protein KN64_00705 [Sulfurovum sp. AS07-7]
MGKRSLKREDMIKKQNSKIVYLDTKEAEMMYELLIKTNDIFKKILKKAGAGGMNLNEAIATREKFQNMLLRTSDVLNLISTKTGVEYHEPFLLAKIRDAAKGE